MEGLKDKYSTLNLDVIEFSKYVINYSNEINTSQDIGDAAEKITNLKLQKIMYYVYSHFLVKFKRKLFNNYILAWKHGPVVAEIYNEYKGNNANGIDSFSETIDLSKELDPNQIHFVNHIIIKYNEFSAVKLVYMTHSEDPWRYTEPNGIITDELIGRYFEKLNV